MLYGVIPLTIYGELHTQKVKDIFNHKLIQDMKESWHRTKPICTKSDLRQQAQDVSRVMVEIE